MLDLIDLYQFYKNLLLFHILPNQEIVLFESYLRGLEEGEISEKLKKYLMKYGMEDDQIIIIYDEQSAVQYCLDVGGQYDFVILSNYDVDDTHFKIQAHKEKLEQEKSA